MSEPTSPDRPEEGAPERLHPLFLLSGLGGALRGIAGGYVAIGYLAVSGRWTTALLGAIGLLAFLVIGIFLYWTRFSFRVGASDIRIDSGIISRRHRSIPFDRIQDVDIKQPLFARLLGLAEVKFETGSGGGGGDGEEAVIHAITLRRAHEIRDLVRARRGVAAAAVEADAGDERPPVYAMDLRRLFLSGTFNFSLAVFAGLFGLTQTMGDLLGFDPLNRRFWIGLAEGNHPLAQYLVEHRAGAAVAGTLLLLVVGLATGVVRTIVRDFGFRLDRTGAGLRRRRGLLTRTDVTLPARRAQAVVVATGPVRDRFGWRELKLQSLARDEGSGDHVLAPLADDDEVDRVLDELAWRPIARDAAWQRLSKAYVTAFAIGLSPVILLLGLIVGALVLVPPMLDPVVAANVSESLRPMRLSATILLAVVVGATLLRWLAWHRAAYALDGDRLLVRSGWWRRRLTILPTAKIQSIDLTENLVSRLFGTATLHFGVAGGGADGHIIPAIPSATARALRKDLLDLPA
ncbi:PH domain-containing protein [Sphingomonas lutea]|uniref:PH domain-containing protein n=1 Tax=Sphingomonas lutea TaxID=1045317 RepID=A0A7G9SJZ7_9SPHN|nr:PH domain-containing protein [Sphingomonas lutea]QNN68172.1 PH domain-containing protein [Sphingomonas lutea]